MTITLDGTSGITTPMYGGAVSSNAVTPVNSFKNRLINGGMVIDQRNAGAAITPTAGQYSVDRWGCGLSQASKYTIGQYSTAPAGFSNSIGVSSNSSYAVGATDYFFIQQAIEGYNMADLAWGTASAKTVTLSFWVRSSLTGLFGGNIQQYGGGYNYPFSYTISSANTWEYKTVTITGSTAGTWATTNAGSFFVQFGLGVGSTYSGTAGAWANTNYFSCTGATSVVGTSGATWYVTGVQLEVGTQATTFDYRSYGTELALCSRYYQDFTDNGTNGYAGFFTGYVASGGYNISMYTSFPVAMRTAPTVTVSGWAAGLNPSPLSGKTGVALYYAAGSGGLYTFRSGAGAFNASAEL